MASRDTNRKFNKPQTPVGFLSMVQRTMHQTVALTVSIIGSKVSPEFQKKGSATKKLWYVFLCYMTFLIHSELLMMRQSFSMMRNGYRFLTNRICERARAINWASQKKFNFYK